MIKSLLTYKMKYDKLKKKYDKLLVQHKVLTLLNKPTIKQKFKVIEDYYKYLSDKDYNANYIDAYIEYKKYLERKSGSLTRQ